MAKALWQAERQSTRRYDASKAEKIRLAVIGNDAKTLEKLLTDKESFSLSFGRFPLLSLAYLYSAHKVIKKFESKLSKIDEYVKVDENAEDYLAFKKRAGKSLRLYLNEQIITPLEMSAVLSDNYGVRMNLENNTQNLDRVKKIYRLTHDVEVKPKGNSIVVPRSKKPHFIELVAVFVIIAVCLVFAGGAIASLEVVPLILGGEGTENAPIKIISSNLFELALEESNRYYTLEDDITLESASLSNTDCKIHIDGQGHTLRVKASDTALFNKIAGSIKNLNVVFVDPPEELPKNSAFFANSISGKVENVEVTWENFNLTAKSEGAFFAHTSTGTLSNVRLSIDGNINEVSELEETVIGTLLYKNAGIVENCNVKYNLSLCGDAVASNGEESAGAFGDAVFGGIVGINVGTLNNSTVEIGSSLTTNTLDVGGIAVENVDKATISGVTNNATLTQTTSSSYWSPNIGGITMRNYGKITSSQNNGVITASTTQTENNTSIIIGGITTTNSGTIDKCVNLGDITGVVEYGTLNVGGIGYLNEGIVTNSTNKGKIDVKITTTKESQTSLFEHHIGGAFAVNNGSLSYFTNKGEIISKSSGVSTSFIGGATGLNNSENSLVEYAQNEGKITVEVSGTSVRSAFVGGISAYLKGSLTKSINLGSLSLTAEEDVVVAGGIIGFTEIRGYSGYNAYEPIYEWSNNTYLSDVGYEVGVGNYFVYELDPFFNMVVSKYYAKGEDVGATPADETTIKNSGVYRP